MYRERIYNGGGSHSKFCHYNEGTGRCKQTTEENNDPSSCVYRPQTNRCVMNEDFRKAPTREVKHHNKRRTSNVSQSPKPKRKVTKEEVAQRKTRSEVCAQYKTQDVCDRHLDDGCKWYLSPIRQRKNESNGDFALRQEQNKAKCHLKKGRVGQPKITTTMHGGAIYNKIHNPLTNRFVNLGSKLGQKILRNYIISLQGGA